MSLGDDVKANDATTDRTTDKCPINQLPNELLIYIFLTGSTLELEEMDAWEYESLNSEGEDENEGGDDPLNIGPTSEASSDGSEHDTVSSSGVHVDSGLPFAVLVSHVCRRWRELALETPILWTFLDFAEGPPFSKSREWIERSQRLPLTIAIDTTPDSDMICDHDEDAAKAQYSNADFTLILDLIFPHIDRLRFLDVSVNFPSHIRLVLETLAKAPSAPILESLKLYYHEEMEDIYDNIEPALLSDTISPMVLFHDNTPKLFDLTLWRVHIPWSLSYGLFSGLRELELAYHSTHLRPSWAAFARMLDSSPELQALTLSRSGPTPSDPHKEEETWPTTPITLPSLVSLTFERHPPDYLCALQPLLHTPALTTLSLNCEDGDFTEFAYQLVKPIKGQHRSLLAGLEQLKISEFPCNEQEVSLIFEQLTHLRSISLDCRFLDDVWFWRLAQSPRSTTNSIHCPLLDTLRVAGMLGSDIRACLQQRQNKGWPLKRVLISEDDLIAPDDSDWLRSHLETFETFEPSDEEYPESEDDEGDLGHPVMIGPIEVELSP